MGDPTNDFLNEEVPETSFDPSALKSMRGSDLLQRLETSQCQAYIEANYGTVALEALNQIVPILKGLI